MEISQVHFTHEPIESDHENIIYSMPCRNPCRLLIVDHFYRFLWLHLPVCSELRWLLPFNQWETFTMQWSWTFILVSVVTLILSMSKNYHVVYVESNRIPQDKSLKLVINRWEPNDRKLLPSVSIVIQPQLGKHIEVVKPTLCLNEPIFRVHVD